MAVVDILDAKINVDDLKEQLHRQGWRVVHQSELELVRIDRYIERFYEIAAGEKTYQTAFEILEAEYYELFGCYRYASLESFRRSITQRKKAE